ncbi:hypothetical protein Tco_0057744 [Tanacetum coccineum]
MTTLAEFMIVAGADNRPPMLNKPQYESCKSRMELYIKGEGHMARQCTQPKRKRDATWFKEKIFLVQEQAEDAYESDYDDISSAKAVLMANLSSYDPDVLSEVVQIVMWYLDSTCSKHMIGNRSQLTNFVNKFLGTVKFGNDQIAKIMGYDDYQIGNVTLSRVYYVEGLGHNVFFVGQFCDLDLDVAFRKHTCFVRNLEGVDLLSGSRGTNLYTLSIGDIIKYSLLAKQGLVRGLPKLKFEKDHLCSACSLGKRKKHSYKPKSEDTNQEKLYLMQMDLYGPMCVESINGRSKQQEIKYTITSSDKAALKEFDQKRTLFETMTKTKSFDRNPKHRALYHALIESTLEDEDAMDKGVAVKLKKRKPDDADRDEDPPAGSDQGLKRRKITEETVFEAEDTQVPQNLGEDKGKPDEIPSFKADPKDWFKKPKRPPTPDPEWNTSKTVDGGPTQNWLSDLAKA